MDHHSIGYLPDVPVISDEDVLARVEEVVVPLAGRELELWVFLLFPDGRQAPAILPVGDMPALPGEQDHEVAFHMLRHFYGTPATDELGLSFLLILVRDGTCELTDADRQWARVLRDATEEYAAPVRMLCLATPGGVRRLE